MITTLYVAAVNGRTLHEFADCRHLRGKEAETRTLRGTCSDGTMTHGMTYCAACDKRTEAARAAVALLDSPNASTRIAAQNAVADGTAFIEVWYNRFTRDWVVEAKTVDGYSSEYGSDYVYTLAEALDIANDKAAQYGVPVRRVTSTGAAYKSRATSVRK